MHNKHDDYVMQMRTEVNIQGRNEKLLICPYPSIGNETMGINDGKQDKRPVNCGWMEALYKGWPYVFVVCTKKGIQRGDELLLDYSAGSYWKLKDQMEFEQRGQLDALNSDEMDHLRTALEDAR